MADFPGEDKKIPKRLVEAVARTPFDYLVPKVALSNLLDSSFSPKIHQRQDVFATQGTETHTNLKGMSFDIGDEANQKILFKRPQRLLRASKSTNENASLFDGLSPLARECLTASTQVSGEQITESSSGQSSAHGKRESRETDESDTRMELSAENARKKIKTGSGVSMNGLDLGHKYLQELMTILDVIKEEKFDDLDFWYTVPNHAPVLSEVCLTKLGIILKNLRSITKSISKADSTWVDDLLKILVGNISCATQCTEEGDEDKLLKKIAHTSVLLIFAVFLISNNDSCLFIEQYVSEPLNFMSASVENISRDSDDIDTIKEQALLLQHSISLLPNYIDRVPYLDESLTTKFVYLFAKLLMFSVSDTNTDYQLQNCWDNIKDYSRKILVTLFRKVPEQQEFIIEEVLSHSEQTTMKRNHKKLRKLDHDIFVTDFTLTLVSFIDSLSYSEQYKVMPPGPEDRLEIIRGKVEAGFECSMRLGSRISDVILSKLMESPSTYRHVVENYVYDLIALLPYPNYSAAQFLLGIVFKRILKAISSSEQHSVNVETIFLQLLGACGASIYEIKCATRPNEGNSLIKLVTYPENISQFMKAYHNCLKFCLSGISGQSGARYLWSQAIDVLLRAIENTKDDYAQNEKFISILLEELKNETPFLTSGKVSRIEYMDVKHDYYSFLHAFDLINLYDPYLKILLTFLESEKIKMKSTAIKCLSMLTSHDKTILSNPLVKHTIGKTLENSPASVKDAMLDLIDRGSATEEYYQQINYNYDDESTLIRKHVLKLNEKIYVQTGSQLVKGTVASKILLKMEDEEESIIEMARDILLKQWISPVALEKSPEKQLQVCKDIIKGMAGVASINEKCARHLEWFLNFYLLNEGMHSSDAYISNKQCLNNLTDVLVQTITELQTSEEETTNSWNREHLLLLLTKFGDCNVPFITKNHIIALYPYLMSDERSDIHYYILHVFRNTLEKDSSFNLRFLHDLETTLLSKLPRMNVKEIAEAMPLIWSIATHQNDAGRVLKACSSCFQHLSPYVNQVTKNPQITAEGKLQRLIYLATGFARYCHFTSSTGKPSFVGTGESVYAFVAKRLLVLSGPGVPHVIRRVALKNLTQLCGSHPNLFNSKPILTLLDKELESDSLDIKLVILESLYDFFTAVERRSLLKAGVNGSISSNERLKRKLLREKKVESVNDGVCSALVTRFLRHILDVCRLADIKGSLVAFRLLKLTLQYGYTNPSHCIPTVIGLVASTNEYMKHVAKELLTELFEKYETMVSSGMTQGVKFAIEYSQNLEGSNFFRNKLFLDSLKGIVGVGKTNSSRFFKIVLKVLKVYFNKINGAHTDVQTRDSIFFISTNLSCLSYPSQFELVDVLKIIEVEAEQSAESLIDEYQDEEEINLSDTVKNTFLVHLCLKHLSLFLMAQYGLKIDISAIEGFQASELKKKLLTSTSQHDFSFELEQTLANFNDQVILEDLTKMVRQAS